MAMATYLKVFIKDDKSAVDVTVKVEELLLGQGITVPDDLAFLTGYDEEVNGMIDDAGMDVEMALEAKALLTAAIRGTKGRDRAWVSRESSGN